MDRPIIIWCVIAAVLLFAFLCRAFRHHSATTRRHVAARPRHLFGLAKEKEMFFIPGDIIDDYDCDDDFDDML